MLGILICHMPRCTFLYRRTFPVYKRTANYGEVYLAQLPQANTPPSEYIFLYFGLESTGSRSTCEPRLRELLACHKPDL